MTIPLETAVLSHAIVESNLSTVSEWRMPEVMAKASLLYQAEVGKEFDCGMLLVLGGNLARNAASDLSYFERMGKPGPIEVAITEIQNLRLTLKSPKGPRVDYTCIIHIEGATCIAFALLPPTLSFRPHFTHAYASARNHNE